MFYQVPSGWARAACLRVWERAEDKDAEGTEKVKEEDAEGAERNAEGAELF